VASRKNSYLESNSWEPTWTRTVHLLGSCIGILNFLNSLYNFWYLINKCIWGQYCCTVLLHVIARKYSVQFQAPNQPLVSRDRNMRIRIDLITTNQNHVFIFWFSRYESLVLVSIIVNCQTVIVHNIFHWISKHLLVNFSDASTALSNSNSKI